MTGTTPAVGLRSMTGAVRSPLRRLLQHMLTEPRRFALMITVGVVTHALIITSAALGAYAIGTALTGDTDQTLTIAVWMIATAVLAALLERWKELIGHDWALRSLRDLRVGMFEGLRRATPGHILGKRTGDLVGTAMNDVSATESFVAHVAGDSVAALVVSLGALAALAAIDPSLALMALTAMIVIAIVPFVLAGRAGELARQFRSRLGTFNAEVLDGIQGIRELAIFGQEQRFIRDLAARADALRRPRRAYAAQSAAEKIASDALLSATIVVALGLTAVEFAAGGITIPQLPLILVLLVATMAPIAQVAGMTRELGDIKAAAERILAIVDYPDQVSEPRIEAPSDEIEPKVTFDAVHFGYSDERPDVLADFTLTVNPGETVALVGRSGAGKSTVINLLQRFWDPVAGTISIGGHDLTRLPTATLRSLIALVPQDVHLFHESIRENIRLAKPDATDAEVERAARLAAADDFIAALPEGYDTPAGERGAQLSGGQRQRIAIARALLKDSPIIVMDEAASNLDAESEHALDQAMSEFSRGRTTILIAHRLSTIRRADRVVLLRDGAVAADGTHEQLLASSADYRALLGGQATT